MSISLATLEKQCGLTVNEDNSGVYAHTDSEENIVAVCFLNAAHIPKFTGRVLRVRHLILSPKWDFGDFNGNDYANVLTEVFSSIIAISDSGLNCKHVKIHFRSPADVDIFHTFAKELDKLSAFPSVKMQGSWLTITKY